MARTSRVAPVRLLFALSACTFVAASAVAVSNDLGESGDDAASFEVLFAPYDNHTLLQSDLAAITECQNAVRAHSSNPPIMIFGKCLQLSYQTLRFPYSILKGVVNFFPLACCLLGVQHVRVTSEC